MAAQPGAKVLFLDLLVNDLIMKPSRNEILPRRVSLPDQAKAADLFRGVPAPKTSSH
jgi:hypothetical protein